MNVLHLISLINLGDFKILITNPKHGAQFQSDFCSTKEIFGDIMYRLR